MTGAGPGRTRRQVIVQLVTAGSGAVVAGLAGACSPASAKASSMIVYRDPNCGCCVAWADHMAATGAFTPTVVVEPDMAALKKRLGVPPALASCHTTKVAGYVIEGHVPAKEVARLLREKPAGVVGIAVPGMPAGSPGMETPDNRRDAYQVIAFTAAGAQRPFARYGR